MNGDINFTVSSPGKVILFGEHSVVYKKAAVSTSVSRRLFVTVKRVKPEEVILKFPDIDSEIVFDLKKLSLIVKEEIPLHSSDADYSILRPELIDHNNYVEFLKGKLESLEVSLAELPEESLNAYLCFMYVMGGMSHTLNRPLVPFSLEVTSDLEVGTGIGSSAAFSVSLSASIFHYCKSIGAHNHDISEVQDNIILTPSSNNSGFSVNELRVINKWAFCLEKITHGRPSGIDNTTSTFGSVVVTSHENSAIGGGLSFRFSENVPQITLLLISSGVSRNTLHLVTKVRNFRQENTAAVDAILNAMDVIAKEAFVVLEGLGVHGSDTPKGIELCKTLSSLMDLNHGLLRTLGVSHERLEEIIGVCQSHGLACKLTGAGGGGFAIALVPQHFSREELRDLKSELGPKFKVTEISIAEQGVRLEKQSKK